jgi:hypothetical protein
MLFWYKINMHSHKDDEKQIHNLLWEILQMYQMATVIILVFQIYVRDHGR